MLSPLEKVMLAAFLLGVIAIVFILARVPRDKRGGTP